MSDFGSMMSSPWTYVGLFAVVVLLAGLFVGVRLLGSSSSRGGGPHDDRDRP